MRIKEIPWYNRPGIRMKRKGVSVLSDAELLAIVLGRGDFSENAIDQANRVLSRYNFHRMPNLTLEELEKEFRNAVKAMKIHAMFEIFKRTNQLKKKGIRPQIKTTQDVYNYYKSLLEDKNKEQFYALFLDNENRLLEEELINVGPVNTSNVNFRKIFSPAIRVNADALILVHNKPNGDCASSSDDKVICKQSYIIGELSRSTMSD
jgi:DNA repair protein RadC